MLVAEAMGLGKSWLDENIPQSRGSAVSTGWNILEGIH